MRVVILMGSPNEKGNTATLLEPFRDEMLQQGAHIDYFDVCKMKVNPCKGCYACQHVNGEFGCKQKDDLLQIVEAVIEADLIILASPIYAWYCTPELKAVIDRLAYGMNKFYGEAKRESLWEQKRCALVVTHGYDRTYATEPFELGMKSLCRHSNLIYQGMLSARHINTIEDFRREEVKKRSREFANALFDNILEL